jgi:putative flippase GtrA
MPPASDRPWYRPAPASAVLPELSGPETNRPRAVLRLPARVRRFLVVGAGGIVVNNAVLVVLHGLLGLRLLLATMVAVEAAIVHNYVLHELWTFRGRRLSARRFVHFSLVTLAAFVINVGVVQVLAWIGLFYLLANLVGIGAGFAVNLAASSMWIWRERVDGFRPAGRGQPGFVAVDGAGGALALSHDLYVGPAAGGGARPDSRGTGRARVLLYRHRAGPARGGRHPGHR